MTVLADIMNYIFSEAVMVIMLFCIHPWLGLAGLAIIAVICCVSRAMRGETIRDSAVMREQSENLTEAVLSFAEGIGTIKSYNLLGARSKELTDNFARSCEKNIAFERHQSVWQRWLQMLYGIGAVAVLLAALWLESTSALSAMMAIGLLLFVFDVFQPIRQYNGDAARLAIMGKCIDRIEEVLREPELSDAGTQRMPAPAAPRRSNSETCRSAMAKPRFCIRSVFRNPATRFTRWSAPVEAARRRSRICSRASGMFKRAACWFEAWTSGGCRWAR